MLVQAALALAPQVDQVTRFGRVDEKRTFIRAFLREIGFDPRSRTRTAYFWAVPEAGCGTRYEPATTDFAADDTRLPSAAKSSLRLRSESARYAQERTAPGGGVSSLIMVAGAGFWRLLILMDEPVVEVRRGRGGEVVAAASAPAGWALPDPAHTDVAQAAVEVGYAEAGR